MVTRQQKRNMLDYLVAKLEGGEEQIVPITERLLRNRPIDTAYIEVGEDGIVFLLDQLYPGGSFSPVYEWMKQNKSRVGLVLLKDGKTYFRSAAEDNYWKAQKELSLKHYRGAMNRLILLRPEEKFARDKKSWVQYYQPDSPKLEESLVSFQFGNVEFDYSHIEDSSRFKPQNKDSERLFLVQDKKVEVAGNLVLNSRGYLVEREESAETDSSE